MPLAHDYAGAPAQLPVDTALGAAQALARARRLPQGRREREVRRPRARQPRRAPRRLRARHAARVLRARSARAPRARHARAALLRLDRARLRRGHRQGRRAHPVLLGRGHARHRVRRRNGPIARSPCTSCCSPRSQDDEKLNFVYGSIEMPALPVLWRMERNGVLLDRQKLDAQSHELGKEILGLEQKAYEAAGQPFNLGSPKQIQEILFDRQKLPVKKKTPSGQPSTDEDSLAELALDHPLPKLILEHRTLSKLKSTYTDKLPQEHQSADRPRAHDLLADHRGHRPALVQRAQPAEHPDPHAGGPAHPRVLHRPAGRRRSCRPTTRRSSCASWRTSRATRTCGARSARARTCTARPPPRCSACRLNKVGNDERRVAKVINFGLIYGMSSFGVAQNLGIDRGTAQTYVERYFARFPGAKRYMDETRKRAQGGRLRRDRVRPAAMAARAEKRRAGAPPGRRARRDQRADAGHRRGPDQAGDDRGAGLPGKAKGSRRC